jgi:Flp pilus assembly pilin Flp
MIILNAIFTNLNCRISNIVQYLEYKGEKGQSTVEYALLLLGAAAIALVLVAWVTKTDLIGRLFDTVVGRILNQAQ